MNKCFAVDPYGVNVLSSDGTDFLFTALGGKNL